jgi:TolB-like protein
MKRLIIFCLLITSLFARDVKHQYVIEKTIVEKMPLSIIKAETPIGNLNSMLIFLTDQLNRNLDFDVKSKPVMVTPFVSLDNFKKTSRFGRFVAENLTHELQVRGWNVIDIRLAKNLTINKDGEFSLTRDINKLKRNYKIGAVVTGTYSIIDCTVFLNARTIDIETGEVISTAQFSIAYDLVANLLIEPRQLPIISIVSE